MISQIIDHYGRLDAIHNNAGIGSPAKPLDETTPEEFEALLNINLKSVYHTTRHGIAALRKSKGCIFSSV